MRIELDCLFTSHFQINMTLWDKTLYVSNSLTDTLTASKQILLVLLNISWLFKRSASAQRTAMSECEESKMSEIVESVRDSVRKNVHEARSKHRHDEIDGFRVAPNELLNHSIDLQSFDRDDILIIVKTMKKNKHAKTAELLKLSHAFLQNTDNIQAFLNTTGAMNVLIKELTG